MDKVLITKRFDDTFYRAELIGDHYNVTAAVGNNSAEQAAHIRPERGEWLVEPALEGPTRLFFWGGFLVEDALSALHEYRVWQRRLVPSHVKAHIDSLSTQLSARHQELARLESQYADVTDSEARLNNQLEEADALAAQLQSELDEQKHAFKELGVLILDLQVALAKSQQSQAEERANTLRHHNLRKAAVKEVERLQGLLAHKDGPHSPYSYEELHDAWTSQFLTIREYQMKVENLEEKLAGLKDTLSNQDRQLNNQAEALAAHDKELNRLGEELVEAEENRQWYVSRINILAQELNTTRS